MSGPAKAGATAAKRFCELRRSGRSDLARPSERASAQVCFLLTIDYIEVRKGLQSLPERRSARLFLTRRNESQASLPFVRPRPELARLAARGSKQH